MASVAQSTPTVASLVILGARIFLAVLIRLVTIPFRWTSWNGPPVVFKDIFFAAIRTMLEHMTIAQSRYIYKGTTETYHDLCKETNRPPNSITLDGVVAHWIGSDHANVVILYLHGGGYTQPCTTGHMQYFDRLVKDINGQSADKRSISILLPAYTLVPEATFPSQLQQAVTVLSHLLGECKRDPSSIMITGDSAGGGLVMTLLSHILRPHPDVRPITLSSPLRGVFVYSPWVSYSTNYASFSRNVGKDALEHNMLRKWAAMYLGTANGESPIAQTRGGDQYSEPLLAEVYWWKGMHTICDEVFIWVGENEIFVDGIEKFAAKFQEGWNTGGGAQERVKLHVAGQEAHIGPIMDMMLQFSIKKRACRSWYSKSG